jgi:hypothetical protein
MKPADTIAAMVVLLASFRAAGADCQYGGVDLKQAGRLLEDMDASRKNIQVLVNDVGPIEKLTIRIATNNVELTTVWQAMVSQLAMLHDQMQNAADRAAVDKAFTRSARYVRDSAHTTADLLTTAIAALPRDEALVREFTTLRGSVRQLESLYECPPR